MYQWYFNGVRIAGANTASLKLADFQASQNGRYAAVVINREGSASSDDANLAVVYPPKILEQPQGQAVSPSTDVSFSVTATGTPPLSFQWLKDSAPILGATGQIYSVVAQYGTVGTYAVLVSNPWAEVTSSVATLSLVLPPTIVVQPNSQRVGVGGVARFSVNATGSTPLRYRWRYYASDVPGATNATLLLRDVTALHAGDYSVFVQNGAGEVVSDKASLIVIEPPRLTLELLAGYPLFTLHGVPGNHYTSTLDATNWSSLVVFTNFTSSPRIFIDPTVSTNPSRFYRAVDN